MAAKIHELRQERQNLAKKANAALMAARDAARTRPEGLFTEAETAEQKDYDAKLAGLDREIEIEEKILDRERLYGSAGGHAGPFPAVPSSGPQPDPEPPASRQGFKSLGQMLLAAKEAARGQQFADQRLYAAAAGANESVDSEGAFLVQTDWGGTLMATVYETGQLASRCTKQPIGASANGVRFNLIDETSRATGSRYGALQVYWAAEADTFTASKPKFRRIEMLLKKIIGLMYVTDELLADAVALEGYVNQWFPKEIAFMLDDAIYRGPGAGRALGVLNAPCLVTINKEAGQAAKTINATNLEKMYAAMPSSSLSNAEWFVNVECWPQIFQLNHAIGTAGVPVFLPGGGISGTPFGTLFGRPITPIEQADALGTLGDILLADFSRYMLIDKGPVQTAASIHVKFLTDEMAYRWVLRVDGQPIPNSPISPYKGAQTLSPFVALQAR